MIKTIFKQIWNQRKMNLWIFLELLAVSFFLWLVLDPVYVLNVNKQTKRGYESKGRYVLDLNRYSKGHGDYDTTETMTLQKEALMRIARIVRNQPEVKCTSISGSNAFPNGGGFYGVSFYADTTQAAMEQGVYAQWTMNYAEDGSQFFQTYGMKDARNGQELIVPPGIADPPRCYISAELARKLFGTVEVVGKKMFIGGKDISEEIAGVFEDYKHRDYNQPLPFVVRFKKDLVPTFGFLEYAVVLCLKEGVNTEAFEARFMKEVAPQLKQGNYYLNKLRTFEEVGENLAKSQGIHVKLNTQFSLAAFALLCIFLGTLGTFWVHCDDRRQDIGVMRSLGASKATIIRQFFVETGLLVTMAFVCALPLLMHYVHESGMYHAIITGEPKDSLTVWWLETVPHFCMVSLLTYAILLLIALLGTYIPVSRAAKVLPADALRDE
ncbi:MAG: ABC transporter permease [Bacteroidaceae bacterium]|nr:ABC transporter permease [Bacteroidaceae bacterium]